MPRRLDDEDRLIRRLEEKRRRREEPAPQRRERDRSRSRTNGYTHSTPRGTSRGGGPGIREERESRQRKNALAAANALFSNPARDALERKIEEGAGRELIEAIDDYRRDYGYPSAFNPLARLVEHPSTEVVERALAEIAPLFDQQSEGTKAGFLQKLRLLSRTAPEPASRKAINAFLRDH